MVLQWILSIYSGKSKTLQTEVISKEYKELNKMGIIEKIFGTHSEHELKRIYPIVDHIDALEPEMQKL